MSFVLAVCAVIRDGDRVLAMRRASHKDAGAGLWETVSGRVEPGEDPLDAIRREIREETGLEVEPDPRPIDAYAARRNEHDNHAWRSPVGVGAGSAFTRLGDGVVRAFESKRASIDATRAWPVR